MLGFFSEQEVDQIYAYEFLQKFGIGLIGIFLPIYIASESGSIRWIFMYLIGFESVFLFVSIPVSFIISRIGFKHSLILSYGFYLPAFLLIRLFSLSDVLVAAVAVLIGVAKAFHWISLHSEFAVDSHEDGRGSSSGKMLGLPRLARSIAPLIGGVVMAWYGFPLLVTLTIIVFILSSLPLFASSDHRDPLDYSFRDFIDRRYLKLGSIFALRGVSIVPAVFLFPLFVYYIGGSIDAGGVSALKGVGSMLFALMLGKASDSFDRKKMILFGLAASSLLFFSRILVTQSFQAFTISLIDGLAFMVFYVPFYSSLADMAEDEDVLEFYAFRELALGVGKLIALVPALYFALEVSIMAGLKASFAAAGISCLLLVFAVRLLDLDLGRR